MEPIAKTRVTEDVETEAPPKPAAPAPPAGERDYRRKPSRLDNPKLRLVLILAVVVLAIVGVLLWLYFGTYESTDDAQIDGHVNSISARVSGHVSKLNVQDNQFVEAGTVLVEIDPTDYQISVNRARADYDEALATAAAAGR